LVQLDTVDDLSKQYYNIFKTGNRNAASHLWTQFILERATGMSAAKLETIFHGFCAISGSPLPDVPRTIYKATLPKVQGGHMTGTTRHCCWPCVCDVTELVWVDTKTVVTADGPKKFNFLVIGDPCLHPEHLQVSYADPFTGTESSLARDAPEVKCQNGRLVNAVYSDHGHPIIGMFFDSQPGQSSNNPMLDHIPPEARVQSDGASKDPTFGFGKMCEERRHHGYDSGMGKIFHLVAKIPPIGINVSAAPFEQKFEMGATDDNVKRSAVTSNSSPSVTLCFMAIVTFAVMMAVMWQRRSSPDRLHRGGRPQRDHDSDGDEEIYRMYNLE